MRCSSYLVQPGEPQLGRMHECNEDYTMQEILENIIYESVSAGFVPSTVEIGSWEIETDNYLTPAFAGLIETTIIRIEDEDLTDKYAIEYLLGELPHYYGADLDDIETFTYQY